MDRRWGLNKKTVANFMNFASGGFAATAFHHGNVEGYRSALFIGFLVLSLVVSVISDQLDRQAENQLVRDTIEKCREAIHS